MKRKHIKFIVIVLAVVVGVFAFVACSKRSDGGNGTNDANTSSSLNGTYYLYVDGAYDKSDFLKIDGESWTDKMGMKGYIEKDGSTISLAYKTPAVEGMPDLPAVVYYGGTIGNGVFRQEVYMGIPLVNHYIKYYCKDGKTPSDLPSGSGEGNDNPTVPSGTTRTVTFDSNGGYTSTTTIQFESGATMQNMPTPTRNGYDFAGWKDSFGKVYDGTSKMPNNDITLIAQWTRKNTNYTDSYVSFIPAIEGTKNIATQIAYSGEVDKFVYVELTSDDLGGPSQVGLRNNFTLTTVTGLNFIVKGGYSWVWYENNAFNTPNGAQRFTLNYGSNFQFVSINDGSGRVLQTYLVDIYVKQDYNISLYSDVDAIMSYETVRVIEGDYFSKSHPNQQVSDFVFDKHVYKTQFSDDLFDFDYSQPIAKDWSLYQTFKAKKITPELNDGTLDGEVTVTPYVKEQTLPIPEKEGCDFIGWKLGYKYFTDIKGNSGVNYLNASNGNETLTAVFEPKHFYWYNDGDELKTAVATPSISYRDNAKTEISNISYSYNGTTLNSGNTFIVGESATVTAVKSGYTFVGWYNGDTQLSDNTSYTFTVPKNEFTYTRKWTYYTLTTDKNISGGSVTNYYEQKITVGDSVTITANTYSGYTFLGWYDGNTQLTDKLSYTFTMPEKNITYTAKWTNCPVTFEKNIAAAGSINVPSSTTIGQSVTVTATTNNGYTWLGWYNGNTLLTADTSYTFILTENAATYTAKWTEYKLTTVANDTNAGYVSNYSNQRITAGQSVTVTATTNNGYTFVGWYDGNRELTEDLSYTFAMPTSNITYTAKWIKVTVVSENTSAGTVSSLNGKYKVGDSATVTASTKNGYTFVGWYNGNRELTKQLSYTFTMPSSNATYTAKWIKVTVVSENTSAGSVSSLNSTYKVGDSATVTASTKNGYTFVGWYDGVTRKTTELSYTFTMPSSNVTYTAKWIKVTLALSDASAGSVSSLNGTYKAGDRVTVTATTNDGYTWIGWYNGNTLLTSNASYDFTMPSSNVTYTATWTYYTVTTVNDNTNAGTITNYSGQKVTAGQSVTITATAKNGYTFDGWYDGATRKTADLSYTFTMPSSNITYTAKWTYYTLTIDRNNTSAGTVSYYNQTKITAGQSTTITATTNSGYTFVGWYNGEQELTRELSYTFTMPSASITYTAKWSKVTLSRSNTYAGTVSSLNSTYKVGDSITITATTNSGYTFVGWYKGEQELTKELSYTFTMPSENVTYTAKWITCPITLNKSISSAGSVSMSSSTIIGKPATVTATTNSGYTWIGWYNGEQELTTELSYTFTMLSESATYTAKWSKVTIARNDSSAGMVSSLNSTYKVGDSVTVTATTNSGYTWIGWYNGEQELTTELSYTFTMLSESATYTAKWSKVTIASNNSTAGLASQLNGTYKVGDSVTITATTISGYTFVGWYDGEQVLTKALSYTFTMSSESVTYTAKWIVCPVTVQSENNDYGIVSISNTLILGECTIMVTEKAGYTFIGWYNGDIKISDNASYSFEMPLENTTYTARFKVRKEYLDEVFIYTESNGIYTITGIKDKSATEILVPGYVSNIADGAFSNCSSLINITISNGTTSIGNAAFRNCSSLTNITMPNSVTSIGGNAFYGCRGLTSITIPSNVTNIEDYTFSGCSSLTSITMPNNVTNIGKNAFAGCSNLSTITIPNSVNSIGSNAFYGCSGLTSITIPSNVTNIGDYTFSGCSSLTSITMPNNVTNIGKNAFAGCNNLSTISMPNSVTSIGDSAFEGCNNLLTITIPNSVTSIGSRAFYGCSGLTSITIPSKVTRIEDYTFYSCNGLTSIIIPTSVTHIGSRAFYGCSGLISITIPSSVTSIFSYAFYGCSSLTSITIPSKVTRIEEFTFYNCSELTSITIPNLVTIIGSRAFYGCSGLTSITIPSNLASIGDYAFVGCSGLNSIMIPNSVTSIGRNAFERCSGLTNITLSSGITLIDIQVFSGCSSLTSVVIPNGVTNISLRAFEYCSKLSNVTIPSSVKYIGDCVFLGCDNLASVTFANTSGWQAHPMSGTSITPIDLSSSSLSSRTTAATYLKSTYCNYYWTCTL